MFSSSQKQTVFFSKEIPLPPRKVPCCIAYLRLRCCKVMDLQSVVRRVTGSPGLTSKLGTFPLRGLYIRMGRDGGGDERLVIKGKLSCTKKISSQDDKNTEQDEK